MSIKARWLFMGLLGATLSASKVVAATTMPAAGDIATALSDPRRPVEQVKLDATRRPGTLIAFAGVKSGARIADFMPGNAYFTRLFSDVV